MATPEFHSEVKAKAAYRHMTIQDYVYMAILGQIKNDNQYK